MNKCYMAYDPSWPEDAGQRVEGFKSYVEDTGGLKLDFEPMITSQGRAGYKLKAVEIINEPKYLMWLLKWA